MEKIVVIGAGNVGAASAAAMAQGNLGSIFLYDVMEDLAAGRAMDINQASPSLHTDCRVTGSHYADVLVDAGIVVVTAGIARRAGMTRLDLLRKNLAVMEDLSRSLMQFCPLARVLVVTNPVDVLTWYLKNAHPGMNVFGLGCSLDTLRFRFFIAEAAGVSVDSVQGLVMGAHNDDMIPLVNHAVVNGIPLAEMVDRKTMDAVRQSTRTAGTMIVQMLKYHSGFYAAARVVSRVVESLVLDRREVFPLSVVCSGHYGYEGIPLALPCIAGSQGIDRVLEIDLDDDEQQELSKCASSMAEVIGGLS
ncbi:MAG TPA: malate dehydrogenase [Desulfomonilia bacterium]|nr:malate dehydrogenase [Desulfomonilia bacterium]